MKILQLVQKPQRRGAEIFAYQLSQPLRQQGHQVKTIYIYPFAGNKPLDLKPHDIVLNGDETHFFEKFPGVHPVILLRLIRQIKRFQPDVIQVNGARTIKYGAFAKLIIRPKQWVIVYRNIDNPSYWVTDPYRKFFYKEIVILKNVEIINKILIEEVNSISDIPVSLCQ